MAATYLRATGEVSTLVSTDPDYGKIVQLGNLKIDDFAKEDDWVSLYSIVSSGTVTATDTFDLDSSIREISNAENDFIRIVHTDTTKWTDYTLVAPNQLKQYDSGNYCAKIGTTLVFNTAFKSTDAEYGGTIEVPAYLFPDHLVNADDEVPVDNPNWLVVATAAEFVRSDITLAQNYPLLLAEANDLMSAMKKANNPQLETVTRSSVARGTEW